MNTATIAVANGKGLQFIHDLIEHNIAQGCSERVAVFETLSLLDQYQKHDAEAALVLIKHLREWIDMRFLQGSERLYVPGLQR